MNQFRRIGEHANRAAPWQNLVVAYYPSPVDKRFRHPVNVRRNEGDAISAVSASFVCGSFVEISLGINDEGIAIETATFRTNGCGFAVSAADVVCGWLSGKQLTDLHGLDGTDLTDVISTELGTFPPDRRHCLEMVFEALRKAMALNREKRVEEFVGEKALICTCFGVSEASVIATIAANGFTHTDQVAIACRAGSGCGACRMLIQELLDSASLGAD